VLLAFDKFKGGLAAQQACGVAQGVLNRLRPSWVVDVAPLADGGDGFCRILTEAVQGRFHTARVTGSQFRAGTALHLVDAELGLVELDRVPEPARRHLAHERAGARVAIVEMAAVNGLALVPLAERDVWHASSRGTGELLREAAAVGANAIVLGVGGSSTSDLGLGALAALGMRFEAADGQMLEPLPANWPRLRQVRGSVEPPLPPLFIACDVDNPLLGTKGAAATYGPQKGLARDDVERFDREAERVARMLCEHLGIADSVLSSPGAGAAGGIAFGLEAAAGARLVPGFELVWRWLELESRVRRADCIITGEGRFDMSSLDGKGPAELLSRAQRMHRSAVLFAGSVDPAAAALAAASVVQISPSDTPVAQAIADTALNLERAVERWLMNQP
jgi:glycerate 2-kinase